MQLNIRPKNLVNLLILVSLLTNLFLPRQVLALEQQRPPDMASVQALMTTALNEAMLRFDKTRYQVQDCAGLTLRDNGFNLDPGKPDSVQTTLYSRLSGDQETATLSETGANTGIFVIAAQCLPMAAGGANTQNGTLQVQPGDLIAAMVMAKDAQNPRALATAIVAGGQATGAVQIQIDPTILPGSMQSTPSLPNQPDFPLALVIGDGVPAFYGEDQVIYRAPNQAALNDFLARRGGTLLTTVKIPLDPNNAQDEAEFYLIRVDPGSFDTAEMAYLMELIGVSGTYTYSSDNAARLIAMLLEEQFAGNAVFPSALLQYQGGPASNEGAHGDIFTQTWFNGAAAPSNLLGLGQATTLLDIVDWRQTGPQVQTAIIDGGFAGPTDYTATPFFPAGLNNPDYGDINGDGTVTFNEIPQCEVSPVGTLDCSPGSAAGSNPLSCSGDGSCPWHGLEMFSIAGAEFNNGFGSAGVGSSAVSPILMKVHFPYVLPVASAIIRSTTMGARVINLSSGFPCRALVVDVCEPFQTGLISLVFIALCDLIRIIIPPLAILPCEMIFFLMTIPAMASAMEAAVRFAEASDVVITASAGNSANILGIDFEPRPPADIRLIPCMLGNVLCVGEIVDGGGTLVRTGVSAFGGGVDIWAPGNMARTPAPDSGGMLVTFGGGAGTSGASAFMAGTAALVRSINPSLNRTQVVNLIIGAGCRAADAGRLAPLPACTPSTDPLVDAVPGGYVDVFEAVRRAFDSRSALEDKLATCTGGWDELTTPADSPTTAIPVPLIAVEDDAFRAEFRGDLSIHNLTGFDQDWYRLTIPAEISHTSIRVGLATAAGVGTLTAQVFQGPAAGLTPLTSPVPAGTSLLVPEVTGGQDFFILITADPASALNDNCYGGSTLTIETVRPPAADHFAGNNSPATAANLNNWQHTDWLCSDEIRRALGNPDARCSDVFENGPADRAAQDVWTMHLDELTLASLTEADFYHITLPDYTDPAQGGHPDIRPSNPPRSPDPEPLIECGVIQREEFAPGGLDPTINVNISGKLIIEAVPTANSLIGRPFNRAGETIGLYSHSSGSWLRNDSLGMPPAPTLRKVIYCPQSGLSLHDLIFSLGERTTPRPDFFSTGGYELNLTYIIEAERGTPGWAEDGTLGRMPCLPGIASGLGSMFSGGFLLGFPNCGSNDFGLSLIDLFHPIDGRDFNDCLADGPNCDDFFTMRWPETSSVFDMTFNAPAEMSFGLYDTTGILIGLSQPGLNQAQAAAGQPIVQRLTIPGLEPDLYILAVRGPVGSYSVEFTPPEIIAAPPTGGDNFIFLPVVIR